MACFIFVWFLIKPYRATGEGRYIGLPLGFGFLGISYLISAITHSFFTLSTFTVDSLSWFQLLARPFAFAFLTFTYFFSKKSSSTRMLWNVSLSILLVALMSLIALFFVAPQLAMDNYRSFTVSIRIFNIICLLYISIHTLRSHIEAKDSKTILIPFGFIFLTISQYSLFIWAVDRGDIPFYGGLALRWIGLSIFLFTAYKSFHNPKKGSTE